MPEIKLKLAYEPPSEEDGTRILVYHLWPCGKTKASLELHFWAKAISPSNELRKTFGHMAEWFEEFTVAYQAELYANPTSAVFIDEICRP